MITRSFNIGGTIDNIDNSQTFDQDGSIFKKNLPLPAHLNMIEKNKLAVKKGNTHSLMNTSTGAVSVEAGYPGKAPHDSGSDLTHSMTNFSKNREGESYIMAQGPPKIPQAQLGNINKRGRRVKLLPSLIDDSRVSPTGVQ